MVSLGEAPSAASSGPGAGSQAPSAASSGPGAGSQAPRTPLPAAASPAAVASAAATRPPFLPVRLDAATRRLVASGVPLLEGLCAEAAAAADPGSGAAVIGLLDCAGPPSSLRDVPLGRLRCRRFLALARCKAYWMLPGFGASAEQLPVETQLLLLELEDGAGYGLLAPLISGDSFRASLRPPRSRADPPGTVLLRLESGDESVRACTYPGVLLAAAGPDPFELLERGVTAAARLSGSARPRWEKETPAALDVFAWCSWDAFYTGVNPRGLQEGLRLLTEGGTPARTLIIDDGWQHMDVDTRFAADADHSVLRGWAQRVPGELADEIRDKLTIGRLVAGEDLPAVEPLHVMELLNERAASTTGDSACAAAIDDALKSRTHAGVAPANSNRGTAAWLLNSAKEAAHSAARRTTAAVRTVGRRLELVLAGWLKTLLEDTSSDSYRLQAFAGAAAGPLRKAILRFYAQASTHSYRLLSLKANAKFESIDGDDTAPLNRPSEHFGKVARELKARCGLDYLAVWHALNGYWSGLMPGAPGVARYRPRLMFPRPSPGTLEVDPSMKWNHPALVGLGIAGDPEALHNDLHAYLAECGVDGVKVDVQSTITMFGYDSGGYAAMGARWHHSLENSVAAHLPGNLQINSMCCAIEDLYNMTNSNICRVGEDFYPALPASHTAHIANAAFNSLFTSALAWPDWDMFHSDHGSARLHAAARAISGGLVYVSDRVGEHDFAVLRRLVLPDGSVLRCCLPGRPTADCLFSDVSTDKRSVLKIWNMNATGGMVGVFNLQGATWSVRRRGYYSHDRKPPPLQAEVRPSDVVRLPVAPRYAVWSDGLQDLRVLPRNEAWSLTLPGSGGHDLLTISPLLEMGSSNSAASSGGEARSSADDGSMATAGLAVAPIGLVNMLNAGGAVLAAELNESSGAGTAGHTLRLLLRGTGRCLVYASRRPSEVLLDGMPAGEVEWDERSGALSFYVPWRQPAAGDGRGGRRTALLRFSPAG